MQQCQDQLQFNIETPDDRELARRFADHQKELADRLALLTEDVTVHGFKKPPSFKPRNRKSKHQKKMERINRDKSTTI